MRTFILTYLPCLLIGLACSSDEQPMPLSETVPAPVTTEQPCDVNALVSDWTTTSLPHLEEVRAIDAIDEQVGVAVGTGQSMWRTEDAGISWAFGRIEPTGGSADSEYTLAKVSFPSPAIGFVLPVSVGAPQLWQTIDGGTSWMIIQQPQLSRLEHIYFFGANDGLAIGYPASINVRRLLRTADGGRTWTIVQNPALRTLQVSFFDGPNGSVVVEGTDIDNVPALFAIGADGSSRRWTRPSSNPLSRLSVLPDGALRARLDTPSAAVIATPGPFTFGSADGGQTWTALDDLNFRSPSIAGHWRSADEGFYFAKTQNLHGTMGQTDSINQIPFQIHHRKISGGSTTNYHPGACALEGASAAFGSDVFVFARKTDWLRIAYDQ